MPEAPVADRLRPIPKYHDTSTNSGSGGPKCLSTSHIRIPESLPLRVQLQEPVAVEVAEQQHNPVQEEIVYNPNYRKIYLFRLDLDHGQHSAPGHGVL